MNIRKILIYILKLPFKIIKEIIFSVIASIVKIKARKFDRVGIYENSGIAPKLIVYLTSYNARINYTYFCIFSLLNQSLKPDKVILWLAEEEFPDKNVPEQILKLEKNGLTIKWCKNTKSYKKLVSALNDFPDDIIVTADDDLYYPKNWLRKLYISYLKNPENVHCHRAHRILFDKEKNILPYDKWEFEICGSSTSFRNFFTGIGGVLYPPKVLHKDVLKEKLFTKLAPNADDIWFWAMAVLNNTKIEVIKNNINGFDNFERLNAKLYNIKRFAGLCDKNLYEGQNDTQLKNVLDYYPQIKETVLEGSTQDAK